MPYSFNRSTELHSSTRSESTPRSSSGFSFGRWRLWRSTNENRQRAYPPNDANAVGVGPMLHECQTRAEQERAMEFVAAQAAGACASEADLFTDLEMGDLGLSARSEPTSPRPQPAHVVNNSGGGGGGGGAKVADARPVSRSERGSSGLRWFANTLQRKSLPSSTKLDAAHAGEWEIEFEAIQDLKFIGSGAQGAVFCGTLNGQRVAVKKLNNVRDLQETEKLRNLQHPNIIRILGTLRYV